MLSIIVIALGSENQHHAPLSVNDKYVSPLEADLFSDCAWEVFKVEMQTNKSSIALVKRRMCVD